jgi:predicted FMN-binding regulatory protein PaiB
VADTMSLAYSCRDECPGSIALTRRGHPPAPMRTSATFAPSDQRDLALFIEKHPLAHVISASGDEIEATPLRLIAETDAAGVVVALIGHFARANRHVESLRQTSRALCIFHGAHGYVSPSWMRDRTQAPTWNFETAHLVVEVAFAEHENETAKAIELLLDAVEGEAPTRWRSHELGDRYKPPSAGRDRLSGQGRRNACQIQARTERARRCLRRHRCRPAADRQQTPRAQPTEHRMAAYRCIAVTTADADRFRHAKTDDFGHDIQRFDVDRMYPCRHCLREASGKSGMLLFSYQTPKPRSVYGQPTAIFMCANGCDRFERPDTIPDIVRNRLVSFRAFDRDGMMIYDANEIVDGGDYDAAVRRIFSRDGVAFINAHTAKAGCMLCHIERA